MPLVNLEQVVTHYTLSNHPGNGSIIDLTNKRTGELAFIKIRHEVPDMYAIRLVDPKTFVAYAETHCKSATTRSRKIILHCGDETNKEDKEVTLKETSRIGFEWCFEWANEKYRWIRESRMSMNSPLECRRKTGGGDVCVAQYLPRGIKNEYFGLIALPGYNMTGLDDQQRQGLELILCISLLTMLDKADGSSWSMIKRNNNNVAMETNNNNTNTTTNGTTNGSNSNKKSESTTELPITPSTSKKEEQKRIKIDRDLQQMLERDIRRSQKQILLEDNHTKNTKKPSSSSASSSRNNSPQVSPIPTPTTSTKTSRTTTLSRQKSASFLRDRLITSQLANMKLLDATATLQLPAAAAAANNTTTPSLATLFPSPPPTSTATATTTMTAPTSTKKTNNKKPVSSNGSLITVTKSAANSTTTSPATTPTAYYATNPLPFGCYAQSSQQTSVSSGAAKSSSSGNVVQSHGGTSVRWDHHTQQLQLQQRSGSVKRPKAQRRVSTGDQILQHHYPYLTMYQQQQQQHQMHSQQQHIHLHQQQQQQQQRYANDYYKNYNYFYNQ